MLIPGYEEKCSVVIRCCGFAACMQHTYPQSLILWASTVTQTLISVHQEIIDFTIRNVSGRFRKVYYTPGLLFWGVFYDNCGKITYSENIYMQGRTIMIAPRKIKHMAEKMERENLEFRTFLKCSADEKN